MNTLKKLRITSVDLCRRGANQQAHIALTKAQEGGKGGEKEVKSDPWDTCWQRHWRWSSRRRRNVSWRSEVTSSTSVPLCVLW